MNCRVLAGLALAAITLSPATWTLDAPIHGLEGQQPAQKAVEEWPMESTGDISVLLVRERYRIYTDHCAEEVPALKPAFEDVMSSLQNRIRRIGTRLLDSDAFKDMKRQAVSSTLLGALSGELATVRQEMEDLDAAAICPETLQSYRNTTDALLEDFLKRTLAGVRSTAQTLKARAEQ